MGIPDGITRQHVEQALLRLKQGEPHGFSDSTAYDVLFESERYPPKAVIGIAAQLATGREFGPDDFSGGEGHSATNPLLRKLGFDVVPKRESQPANEDRVWLEITRGDHGHGGPGWEFGTCLWSPTRDKAGRDRYAIMREPREGDFVIHSLDSEFVGQSRITSPARETTTAPPSPGQWAEMTPYYRIDLGDYRAFRRPLAINKFLEQHGAEIRRDILDTHPERYPFYTERGGVLRIVQGVYLSKCSPLLVDLLYTEVEPDESPRAVRPKSSAAPRYWCLGAAEQARLWPEFYDQELVAIGWDFLGDLRQYPSAEAIADAMRPRRSEGINPTNDALACYQFANEVRSGDFIFVKQGTSEILGYGSVTSPYEYRADRTDFRNVHRVKWLAKGRWQLPEDRRVPRKTLTDVTRQPSLVEFVLSLVATGGLPKRGTDAPVFSIDDAVDELFLERDEFVRYVEAINRKRNLVLQGPPGVGKTFIARRLAYALVGYRDRKKTELIQFHQSYSYEDFIQGWRPTKDGRFRLARGVFYDFVLAAREDTSVPHVFMIDELNRGNLSKIFGELLMLIEADKRGPDFAIPLMYAADRDDMFYVPENVYVIGMMNTADRSLALVDYAIRRRFAFFHVRPAFGSERFQRHLRDRGVDSSLVDKIVKRMTELNADIAKDVKNLGIGYEIGHSFFCPQGTEEKLDDAWFEAIVTSEVEPLLHEYWFDDPQRAKRCVERLLE